MPGLAMCRVALDGAVWRRTLYTGIALLVPIMYASQITDSHARNGIPAHGTEAAKRCVGGQWFGVLVTREPVRARVLLALTAGYKSPLWCAKPRIKPEHLLV